MQPTLSEDDQLGKERVEGASAREHKRMDDEGAATLSAGEQANLDQIESGLQSGDTASEPGSGSGKGSSAGGLAKAGAAIKAAGGFVGANKKKFGIGGGAAGFLLAMILGFFALLPLKIESLMKNIYGNHSARVENAVERRTTKIFIKYAMSNSLSADGAIVSTGNPLGDLYKTWRTQGFEKDLAEKYGLKIEKGSAKGHIKITTPEGTKDFASESQLADFMDKDLTNRQAAAFIKTSVKNETKWYQIIKRAHLRRWMANAYGVKKWKIFDKKEGKDAETNLDTELKTAATEEYEAHAAKGMACILGDASSCPDQADHTAGDNPVDGDTPARGQDVQAGVDEAIGTATADELDEVVEKTLLPKLASKAVPVIGWIDLGARLDKVIYDNSAEKVIDDLRKVQYASVFASWLILSDQIKDGKTVSGDEVNVAMKKLEGSEKSNTSAAIYDNQPDAGEKISDNKLFGHTYLDAARQAYIDTTGFQFHPAMVVYLHSVGKIFDILGGALGWLIGHIPGVSTINDFIGKLVLKAFMFIFRPVVTGNEVGAPLVNAIDVGGDVTLNDEAQEYGAQPLSGQALYQSDRNIALDTQADNASKGLWYKLASTDNPASIGNRLLGLMPVNAHDAVAQGTTGIVAAITAPFKLLGDLGKQAFLPGLNPIYAADDGIDKYGLQTQGWTEADLNSDIDLDALKKAADRAVQRDPAVQRSDGSINASLMIPEDCDADPAHPTVPNMCKINLMTIQSLKSNLTNEDDGGLGSAGAPAATTTTTGSGDLPTGSAQDLAKQILANNNIDLSGYSASVKQDVELTAQGKAGTSGSPVSALILSIILKIGQDHKVLITAIESNGQGHAPTSRHYTGDAVDFGSLDGARITGRNAPALTIINAIKGSLPSGSGFGQDNCGATPSLPSGIDSFDDTCNHLHVQVPRGSK